MGEIKHISDRNLDEMNEMAKVINRIFSDCLKIDEEALRETIRIAERQETIGAFTMSPFAYLEATNKNREVVKKVKTLIRLVELVKAENNRK